MSDRVLTLLRKPESAVDASRLLPELLAGLDDGAIADFELRDGLRVSGLFAVSGGNSAHLVIRGECEGLMRLGSGMKSGVLTVEGNCGDHAGAGMRGGILRVTGSAGAFAGAGMSAGLIEVRGNAGDFLGSALPGSNLGMRGGVIVVQGNAGDRIADRMRRGLMLVAGNAGDHCCAGMLAGTVLVAGEIGAVPGLGLKRGSLLLARSPEALPATFEDCGEHDFLFLSLLEKDLLARDAAFARFLPLARRARRLCGDLAQGGTGEILVFA